MLDLHSRPFSAFYRKGLSLVSVGRIFLGLTLSLMPLFAQEMTAAGGAESPAVNDSSATAASAPSTTGAAAANTPSGSYLLQSNDLIRITVFQEDDMATQARISKSGYVTFPLLGAVLLRGKSVDDATADIRRRLDKDYIINPHVTLTVMEYAKQWVTVLGEVQKPGQIEIPPEGGLDLLGAIALAGGYTRVANPARVIVRRVVDGHDVILRVNAKELARDVQVKQFLVRPGDRISIAESIF
jgi:protein involved in polysaccharide export with SLBB domain